MCLYKLDSQYASGPKCVKNVNMAKFWTSLGSQYAGVKQRSKYSRINLGRVINIF